MNADWPNAYIGLGANLGDPALNLRQAADQLCGAAGISCVHRSHIYETSPLGGPADQPDYLNAVIHLRTSLPPEELLQRCLAVETQLGRVRRERNGPRIIDLDLLLFENERREDAGLHLPHPRLHQRRFVLVPLVEIAPGLLHPRLGQTMAALLAALPPGSAEVRSTALSW